MTSYATYRIAETIRILLLLTRAIVADQRQVRGTAGDDPPVGQVPPLHGSVPEGDVAGVGQFGVGALPVPHLSPRIPGILQDRGDRP